MLNHLKSGIMTALNASSFLKSLDKVMSSILEHIHDTEDVRGIQELTFI